MNQNLYRDSTPEEDRWFKRLQRVLIDIPKTVEVTVHVTGQVAMHHRGATEETFKIHGHSDNVPELGSFQAKNLRGQESSV